MFATAGGYVCETITELGFKKIKKNNYSQNRGHHKLVPASVFINSLNQ